MASLTGTLILPDISTVKQGTTYGSPGSLLTGTFVGAGFLPTDTGKYGKLALIAKKLIDKNGRVMTVTVKGRTAIATDTPWRGNDNSDMATDPVVLEIKGLFTGQEFDDDKMTGTRKAYQIVLVSALSAGLDVDLIGANQVDDGSDKWLIHDVKLLYPGDTRLLWKFRVYR